MKNMSRWLLTGFFFSFSLFILPVFADENWQALCQTSKCYAVVDAGSSGTRFYIYSHDYQTLWSKKITPGLAQVSPDKVSNYLQQLVPNNALQAIPTYIYGTAGMRLISEDEQFQRYAAVKQWFSQKSGWLIQDVRTILGKEEGFFAWLAANQNENVYKGVLEIGGASYQVNIPVSQEIAMRLSPEDITRFSNRGQTVYVWSKSYLGLGINEVEKKVALETTCYSQNYPLSNGSLAQGDISQCIQTLESHPELTLLQQFTEAQSILKNQQALNWVTLGAIKFSISTPPYRFNEHSFNWRSVRAIADTDSCHENWGSLIQKYTDPFLYRQCLAASYFYASIVDGLGVSEDATMTYPNNQQNMDWTVGALLYQQTKV